MIRSSPVVSRWLSVLFGLLLALIALRTLRAPQSEFGDGREYVLQTQGIVFDHTLAIDPERRADYWNETNPFGVTLKAEQGVQPESDAEGEERQFGGKFGSLYLARDGSYRYVHSWVYSLVVAPIYALLHASLGGTAEYFAFRIVNLIALFLPLVMLWRRAPRIGTLVFFVAVLTSPITPHLQFAHSEIFCLSAVMLSLATAGAAGWRFASPFLLGLGAAQNIPIAFLFPLHLWLTERGRSHISGARSILRSITPYLSAAMLPLGMMLYNFWEFGTWNLIAQLGHADPRFVTWRRMVSVFVSPMIGVVWYLPACWLAVIVSLRKGTGGVVLATVLSVLAVAAVSSTTDNINSAQLSACRYAVWYLGPLYVLPFLTLDRDTPALSSFRFFTGLVPLLLIWWWLGTYRFLAGESFRFFSSQRAQPEVAALYRWSHLHDDIEPLVENITAREIPVPHRFRGIYVWNLDGSQSLWIVSLRAFKELSNLEARSSSDLTTSASLQELFDVRAEGDGRFALRPKDGVTFDRHPQWGGYRLIWVDARIEGLRSSVLVVVR